MKKIKILTITLIAAFAALGGAYALWHDSLFIDETVQTGKLSIQWLCSIADDRNNTKDLAETDNPIYTHKPTQKRNVGSSRGEIDKNPYDETEALPDLWPTATEDRNDADLVTITLNHVYPGYQESVYTVIQNDGDIPVKLQSLAPVSPKLEDWKLEHAWLQVRIYSDDYTRLYWDSAAVDGHGPDYDKFTNIQIDPGGGWLPLRIVQRVLNQDGTQEVPQNASRQITFKVKAVQWNAHVDKGDPFISPTFTAD